MTDTTPTPVWHGRHGKGAMAARREQKRVEAEARAALTPYERTRAYRRTVGAAR